MCLLRMSVVSLFWAHGLRTTPFYFARDTGATSGEKKPLNRLQLVYVQRKQIASSNDPR
jgi:hypothetical protein